MVSADRVLLFITGRPEKKSVKGKIKHLDQIHIPEVQSYKTYTNPEFRKNVIALFKPPDLSQVKIKELKSQQEKPDESVLEYMGRVQDNVAKAFPKLPNAKRQDLAVSMFGQGRPDVEFARMTGMQAKGDVASALRIGTSATAFGKSQHNSQRYEPRRPRYPAYVAGHDHHGDAEEVRDEGAGEEDYDEQ